MKIKTTDTESRVYKYGCKPPTVNADKANRQLRLANQAWNELAKMKREHVEAYREFRDRLAPKLTRSQVSIEERVDERSELRQSLKMKRVEARSKIVKDPESKARIKELTSEIQILKARYKELRELTKEIHREPLAEFKAAQKIAKKELLSTMQNEWRLYWPTKNAINKSLDFAKSLRNRPFDGSGRLVIQDSGHVCPTWAEFTDGKWKDGKLDLQRLPNGKLRGFVSVCIGRWSRGDPTFVTLPVTIHREPPPEAIVKMIVIVCRCVAGQRSWELHVTLDDQGSRCFRKPVGVGRFATDIGWRMTEKGIKVLTWVGDDGEVGVEYLPKSIANRFSYASTLRGIRDKNRTEMIDHIRAWKKDRELPEWIADALSHVHKWKSSRRIYRLLANWQPYPDGNGLCDLLIQWEKQDRHNWRHEAGCRKRAIAARRDWQSCLVDRLRKRYGEVIIDMIGLKHFAKNGEAEAPNLSGKAAKYQKVISAAGEINAKLRDAMPYRDDIGVAYSSMRCATCKHINTKSSDEVLTCESCGSVYDRNVNACLNMLASADVPKDKKQRKIEVPIVPVDGQLASVIVEPSAVMT